MAKDSINIEVSDDDADGICVATVFEDGKKTAAFDTTQAEMKVWFLTVGGFAIPAHLQAKAEAEEGRRVALGRTLFEEVIASVSFTIPVADLRAAAGEA